MSCIKRRRIFNSVPTKGQSSSGFISFSHDLSYREDDNLFSNSSPPSTHRFSLSTMKNCCRRMEPSENQSSPMNHRSTLPRWITVMFTMILITSTTTAHSLASNPYSRGEQLKGNQRKWH